MVAHPSLSVREKILHHEDPARLEKILTNAGFQQVSCSSFESVMRMGANRGIEGAVDFLLRIGPVASLLREASPDSQEAAKSSIAASRCTMRGR